jgi:hypothetical protein
MEVASFKTGGAASLFATAGNPPTSQFRAPWRPPRAVRIASATVAPKMPVDVVTEIVIERPRAAVAAFAGHPDNAPRWYVNIQSVEWKTPPPLAVGSRVAFVARFLGRRLAYTYEFVELVDHERCVMRTAEGPFPMETTYAWSDVAGGGTRMMLRNCGEPAGFSRLVAPMMAGAMRRANQNDLSLLKSILEAD